MFCMMLSRRSGTLGSPGASAQTGHGEGDGLEARALRGLVFERLEEIKVLIISGILEKDDCSLGES